MKEMGRPTASRAFAAERLELQALPATPFDALLKLERRVSHDGLVSIGGIKTAFPIGRDASSMCISSSMQSASPIRAALWPPIRFWMRGRRRKWQTALPNAKDGHMWL